MENQREIDRYVITGCLLYGAFLTMKCPCGQPDGKGFLSCHQNQFLLAVGIPVAICLYENNR
jgi:hypothetical protein